MELKPFHVSQVNHYISRLLSIDPVLSDIRVIGEISNLKFQRNGNVYFSLKDDSSTLSCYLPRDVAPAIRCPLKEGLEVIVTGFINVYEPGGYYSLRVRDIELEGSGRLAQLFDELKQKLQAEGLFDASRKKALPVFPLKVAVVTSSTGAAVRDIQRTIQNKNDVTSILIVPVAVQGSLAAGQIAEAIRDLNQNHPDVDVMIVGRGGGSIEDLWAFNEEIVARAIAGSDIPVISGVGHEIDHTIADLVADYPAATPTAAAEKAVPNTRELREHLDWLKADLSSRLIQRTDRARQHLSLLDPAAFASGIRARIEYEQKNLQQQSAGMEEMLRDRISKGQDRIDLLRKIIEAASPYAILSRGYSMITGEDGQVIRSVKAMDIGQTVTIRMSDGSAAAQITDRREEDLK